jgi:hypothetical protein
MKSGTDQLKKLYMENLEENHFSVLLFKKDLNLIVNNYKILPFETYAFLSLDKINFI